MALAREINSRRGIAYALGMVALAATGQQDVPAAVRAWEESLALLRAAGDRWGMARPLNNLGELAQAQGDDQRARALFEEALRLRREAGDRAGLPNVLTNLACVSLRQGDEPAAHACATEALAISASVENGLEAACALEVLALLHVRRGRADRAASLWGAAGLIRETIGAPLEARGRDDYTRGVAAARLGLGDGRFADAWTAGRATPLARLVAEALDDAPLGAVGGGDGDDRGVGGDAHEER